MHKIKHFFKENVSFFKDLCYFCKLIGINHTQNDYCNREND